MEPNHLHNRGVSESRSSATLLIVAIAIAGATNACAQTPTASTAATRMIGELVAARDLQEQFAQYQTYASGRFDASSGTATYADKTGKCRLAWVDYLLRNQVESIVEADEFTSGLHGALVQPFAAGDVATALGQALVEAERRTVIDPAALPEGMEPASPRKTLPPLDHGTLVEAINRALRDFHRAFEPLTEDERADLRANLYPVTAGNLRQGYSVPDAATGMRLCDLLVKLDRTALFDAAHALRAAADPRKYNTLGQARNRDDERIEGVTGHVLQVVATNAGRILVGGKGNNVYQLDELTDVTMIIDRGGNDTYLEGTTTVERPILIIVDQAGDDIYRGTKPGVQGGAIIGLSLLIDHAGDDRYEARDVAQGAALAGVGVLIDLAGNDTYLGDRRVQGSAFGGAAILIDAKGDDDYRAALLAQAVGGPLGFGLLDDLTGDDHYYAGGKYESPYNDSPGYGGWSQGMGVGPRGVANGGIGVLLDGDGDDVYECDYFSHAGGYWFAAGFTRDFGGNDQRLGSTRTTFDGSPRTVARFLRWGVGFGCHFASGFLIDDAGDDEYYGNHASVCYSWDIGVGAVIDAAGNDKYVVPGSVAGANNAAIALLFDAGGDDTYQGNLAIAGPAIQYHPQDQSGGNFSFLIDMSGADKYNGESKDNYEDQCGWLGGFLIDRQSD
ncbi:MAG: hypothetical protein CMJ49_10585 [Planctomycetaceae bacterium]|nr:hypothetical protein [Planctomycetaceae bacterium]